MFSFVKIFFILISFLFIASCHEKDYNILRDFIMKDQQVDNLKKLDTLESDNAAKSDIEKNNIDANSEKKDKQADSLKTKKLKKKKFHRTDQAEKDKELKLDKNTSRVLEVLKSQKEKTVEIQSDLNKTEEEDNFNGTIKVGVMLPLSGEHSEIGN